MMEISRKDELLIKVWKEASIELNLEIITPFIMSTENGKINYPLLIKYFGRKNGTIVTRHDLLMDYPMPKDKDYFFSAVNINSYSKFDRQLFIETLEDWGYFGKQETKPKWYNGILYDNE